MYIAYYRQIERDYIYVGRSHRKYIKWGEIKYKFMSRKIMTAWNNIREININIDGNSYIILSLISVYLFAGFVNT